MITDRQIVDLYRERRMHRDGWSDRSRMVRDLYNGDYRVPLPELDDNEKPAIANLLLQGVDQFAMRAASTFPNIVYPPTRPGFENHELNARTRELAAQGWLDMNSYGNKLRYRFRYLAAYGETPVSIAPISPDRNDKRKIPFWRVRNPFTTFPAPSNNLETMTPENVIFCEIRTLSWLQENYPIQARQLFRGKARPDSQFEILEFVDAEECVLVAVGQHRDPGQWHEPSEGLSPQVELERVPNRAGVCPVVVPGRITLDRLQGQFDQLVGMYHRQAKLDALNTISVQRSVFPEQWALEHPGSPRRLKIVKPADGQHGEIGEIEGGTIINMPMTPSPVAETALANLERAQRVTGMIPAEFGGESPTNVRTARRGEMIIGNTVDMPIQESQELIEQSMQYELRIAAKIMKAYHGDKPSMFILPSDGKVFHSDYVPNDAFDNDLCYVKYSVPGADVNGLVISISQRVGTSEMSLQTAREMDPAIEDPIRERDQVELEGMRHGLLNFIETGIQNGQIDPMAIVRMTKLKASKRLNLEDCWEQVHREMQQEQQQQAEQAQAQQPQGEEGQPGANMPPGGLPSIPPTSAGSMNLADVLKTIRRPTQTSQAENQLAAGAQ